jgi:hypothetical protein
VCAHGPKRILVKRIHKTVQLEWMQQKYQPLQQEYQPQMSPENIFVAQIPIPKKNSGSLK